MANLDDTVFMSLYREQAARQEAENLRQQQMEMQGHQNAAQALRERGNRDQQQRGRERELAMKIGASADSMPSMERFQSPGTERVAGAPEGMPFLGGSAPEVDRELGGLAQLGFKLRQQAERERQNDPRFKVQQMMEARQRRLEDQRAENKRKQKDVDAKEKYRLELLRKDISDARNKAKTSIARLQRMSGADRDEQNFMLKQAELEMRGLKSYLDALKLRDPIMYDQFQSEYKMYTEQIDNVVKRARGMRRTAKPAAQKPRPEVSPFWASTGERQWDTGKPAEVTLTDDDLLEE